MGILSRIKKTSAKEDHPTEQTQAQNATVAMEDMGFSDVIIRPLISEKAAGLAGANQYVFVVRKDANRIEVRQAMKKMYGVSPLSVNIVNTAGKKMRFGRRKGQRSDWKKAIITLAKGQTINVHEGV